MVFGNATNLYRKSGVAEGRDLRCAIRMPTFTVLHHFLLCHLGGTGRIVP
jgi:hypothetical protein